MKLPSWLKTIWWFLLVIAFAYLVYQRYDDPMSGNSSTADIIILIILFALLIIPLFKEVSIFGVSFKKEIDNLKSEFKEQIINLRSDIHTINMTGISQHITVGTQSSDSELKDLEKNVIPIIEKALEEQGKEKPVPALEELDVLNNTVFLFKVRYVIDKELMRIINSWWAPPEERRYQSTLQRAISLSNRGIIVPAAIDSIREIYAICSQAIHGVEVSEASVKFVKDMLSPLLPYLKSIETQSKPDWKPPSKETPS